MLIERIQVEEGFLDGLNVAFSKGLNAIIGSRGTGKTSVIELLRFCLAVQGYTDASHRRAYEHARSILGSGQVTVTLTINGERVVATRTAGEEKPRVSGVFQKPIIFSQTEIESVGLEETGRLKLVDGFIDNIHEKKSEELFLASEISSHTTEMRETAKEIEALGERIQQLEPLREQIKQIEEQEAKLAHSSEQAKRLQAKIQKIGETISLATVRSETLEVSELELNEWRKSLQELLDFSPDLGTWPESAGPDDILKPLRLKFSMVLKDLGQSANLIMGIADSISEARQKISDDRIKKDQQARELRLQFERLQKGSGVITRKANEVREKLTQLSALHERVKGKKDQLNSLQAKRGIFLDSLDIIRQERFEQRLEVANKLNTALNPAINIEVTKAASHPGYTNAITSAIRGSKLHYGTLAPTLAAAMSPRELVEAVERGDSTSLAEAIGIQEERASRIVGVMREVGTEDILVSAVEDGVNLQLLDGSLYKTTEDLSTGQRCTAVLPILLAHTERTLLIDQPEDHLDNAFIVDTLIEAIGRRSKNSQLIFTTHNANIPVLGDAALVVQLESDGKRGFVANLGRLEEPDIVDAITSVMEGGMEAFERRAKFYREHSS